MIFKRYSYRVVQEARRIKTGAFGSYKKIVKGYRVRFYFKNKHDIKMVIETPVYPVHLLPKKLREEPFKTKKMFLFKSSTYQYKDELKKILMKKYLPDYGEMKNISVLNDESSIQISRS